MRTSIKIFATTLVLCATCTAFGAGGGTIMPNRDQDSGSSNRQTPEEHARSLYNTGVKLTEKADDLEAAAARQTDEKKQAKAFDKAKSAYVDAFDKFAKAAKLDPGMAETWNYLGYTARKRGKFEDALAAYDRALTLKPGYPQAIEYRGHAYLALDRLSEAKEAYLSLFNGNRKLASQLLSAMQDWVSEHRAKANGIDGPMLDSFESWVKERSAIAGQTVGLTREGATARW